jgi:hypothetical protein
MSEDDLPPEDPPKPKRLSFREANLGPEHRPEPPAQPHSFFTNRKRSVSIGLIGLGAGAAVIYAVASHRSNCDQNSWDQATSSCQQGSGHTGGGAHFYSGGGSSGSSSSSSSEAGTASRGGFGASGSAHGGGGE